MNLLKSFFNKKDEPIKTYHDFWNWFERNQKLFHNVVKGKGDVERFFFEKLTPKLVELREGIFFLTGMCDKNTVELILTPDGVIKNIYFVEELIAAAPKLDGWRFTALKQPWDIKDVQIGMAGYKFAQENINFYANYHPQQPDKIDIKLVHQDYTEENKATITHGVYLFADNFLGELNFATTIDDMGVIGKSNAAAELIPVEKLRDFLTWRQAEFVEKYEGIRYDTENDNYRVLQGQLESGNVLLVSVNTDLMDWDSKPSHPWMLHIEITYGDSAENKGMPHNDVSDLLVTIEHEIMEHLKDADGFLNLGHTTGDGARDIYFACKDFRTPSKVLDKILPEYADNLKITFTIYKDKYWQTVERFRAG